MTKCKILEYACKVKHPMQHNTLNMAPLFQTPKLFFILCVYPRQLSCKREQMINLLTLFYSFSGLVPGTGPRSQLNKLGDKDLCCVGVETLNHLQYSVCNPQNVININHEASWEKS